MSKKTLSGQLSPELENFDRLPDAAYVKQRIVERLFACSSATLWRRVKSGLIPPPNRLSTHSNGWNVGCLRTALSRLKATKVDPTPGLGSMHAAKSPCNGGAQ